MNLITLLQSCDIEPSAEDLADICLLVQRFGDLDSSILEGPQRIDLEKDKTRPHSNTKDKATKSTLPDNDNSPSLPVSNAPVHGYQRSALNGETNGLPITLPSVRALHNPLDLARALRPLMRRIPSQIQLEIDENASAEYIAETNGHILIPVLRSRLTRWLDVAIVVDRAPSMGIWRQEIEEWKLLLERQGAFRNVRLWSLSSDLTEYVRLKVGWGESSGSIRSAKELTDPSGRNLILVLSDCVAPAWRGGKIQELLLQWGKKNHVAIVQMMPPQLWKQSCLGFYEEGKVSAALHDTPSAKLVMSDIERSASGMPLPIVSLTKDLLSEWAKVVAGISATSPGIWLKPGKLELDQDRPEILDADKRIQQFEVYASKEALQLARALAAAPLSPPIMRLVHQTIIKHPRTEQLAEVMLGGLFYRTLHWNEHFSGDEIQYEFYEGVRKRLLRGRRIDELFEILHHITQYEGDRLGQVFSFRGLLFEPDQAHIDALRETNPAFASVLLEVLQAIGGQYASLAQRLRERTHSPVIVGEVDSTIIDSPDSTKNWYVAASVRNTTIAAIDLDVIVSSQVGDVPFALPFDLNDLPKEFDTLSEWKEKVFEKLIGNGILRSEIDSDQRMREFGRLLFDGLFPNNSKMDKGRKLYHELANKVKTDKAKTENNRRRLRLRLNLPSELQYIPWELLWCPVNNFWPAVDTRRAIIRTLPPEKCNSIVHRGSPSQGPLRIVVVLASPERNPLAPPLKEELMKHQACLQGCHAMLQQGNADVIIEYIEGTGTYQQLAKRLKQPEPIHILHFFCHGELVGDEAYLQFVGKKDELNDRASDMQPVAASSLREQLRQRLNNHADKPVQLVVLNACFSGNATPDGMLSSLAAELIQEGIPSVIAMQGTIEPKIVHKLTQALYDALLDADFIDQALTKARSELYEDYKSTLEWATPMLFLHPQITNIRVCDHPLPRLEQVANIGVSPYDFLEAHGLGIQPNNRKFFNTSAEDIEPDRLLRAFIIGLLRREGQGTQRTQPIDKVITELLELETAFLFAPEGYGKTSYRLLMEKQAEQQGANIPLIVSFNFVQELGDPRKMKVSLYIQYIKRKVYEALQDRFNHEPARRASLQGDAILLRYFNDLERDHPRFVGDNNPYWLPRLSQIAVGAHFSGVCFIFEDLYQYEQDPLNCFNVIKPLLKPALLRFPGFAFKFFVPNDIAGFVRNSPVGRLDNVRIYYINKWPEKQLQNMLNQMFYYYRRLGKERDISLGAVEEFSDLCSEQSDIDRRLIKAANGSPRELIRLMKSIIDAHCAKISNPSDLIRKETIDEILRPYEL